MTKRHISIKCRFTDKILFEGEYTSLKECVGDAISKKVILQGADLRSADLQNANLQDADLRSAYLQGADLRSAYLQGADLRNADLQGADLRNADLRNANLRNADLRNANLRNADLQNADLQYYKTDLIAEILKLPDELETLRDALVCGKINGLTYSTAGCSCLAGTIAKHRGITVESGGEIKENGLAFKVDSSSPREQWFANIREGDTPDKNQCAKLTLEWIEEAIAIRDHIRATGKE